MTSDNIEALAKARFALFQSAWETRDVDALTALHSRDVLFTDFITSHFNLNYDDLLAFNLKQCSDFSRFTFSEVRILSAGLDHAAVECTFDSTAAKEVPEIGMEAGDVVRVIGVFHFLYKWEGAGMEWDGSVSDEAVQGWKIVEERHVFVPVEGKWSLK